MLYSWQGSNSLIKEVELFKIGEQQEAFIYAPLGAEKEKLSAVTDGLRQRGFEALPDIIEGKHVLRVLKFNNREHLFSALESIGGISGTPHTQISKRDPKSRTLGEKFKDSTMSTSGWLFTVGDALMILSGALRKDWAEAGTGFIWGSSGLVLGLFGKKKPENQLGTFYRNLETHLQQEGIPMPRNERELVDSLKRDNGMITRVIEFLENNPADFHHVVQSLGGTTLIKAGYNQNNWYKAAAGGFVTVGQAMGVLLPDKANSLPPAEPIYPLHSANSNNSHGKEASGLSPSSAADGRLPPEPDNRGAISKGWDWFTSNPLHFSGIFPFINNVLNITGAFHIEKHRVEKAMEEIKGGKINELEKEVAGLQLKQGSLPNTPDSIAYKNEQWKKLQGEIDPLNGKLNSLKGVYNNIIRFKLGGKEQQVHPWQLNLATAGLYIAANLLYAVSKKDTSSDLKAIGAIDEMTGVMANIVSAAPDHMQSELTHQMSGYLGTQPDVKMTIQDIDRMISEKVASLRESPWESKKKSNSVTNPVHMGPLVAANQNITAQPGVA